MTTRNLFFSIAVMLILVVSGCSSTRMNLAYNASSGSVNVLPRPVTGVLLPSVDQREGMKTYPKQVIVQNSYFGGVTYEINDRTVEDVFNEALTSELKMVGVNMVKIPDLAGPLDKETSEDVRKKLSQYPEVRVAFGAKITDFMADSQRNLVTTKVKLNESIQFYILNVETGEVLWSDYKADWSDTVVSADRNDMIVQLNQALANLMHKTVRDNISLRDLLIKISNR